ncbi:hypothetical protein XELAEV_18031954mg [Xenopus laevis]|uniref:Uncharacterized protein n=1 Tax=Xenopus laevis TaxID=8355 RepID=A0A974CPA8_XENLA|nr:hypothetical protein XELAEV_18031954mg [Xenopus laevis]
MSPEKVNNLAGHPSTTAFKNYTKRYCWTYPFGIQVTRDGRTTSLTSPDDISQFCRICGIEEPDLSDWEKLTLAPAIPELPDRENWTDVSTPKSKKKKHKMTPEKSQKPEG